MKILILICIIYYLIVVITPLLVSKIQKQKEIKTPASLRIMKYVKNKNHDQDAYDYFMTFYKEKLFPNFLGVLEKIDIDEEFQTNKKSHFDYFWDFAINAAIEKVQEEIDSEFRDYCKLHLRGIENYKKALKENYTEKREWLKTVYLPHEKEEACLDFHKLASVVCRCVIGNKPFVLDEEAAFEYIKQKSSNQELSVDWFTKNIYCNYRVAFYASLGILYIDTFHKLLKEDRKLAEDFNVQQNMKFYSPSINHENFENSTVLALMKENVLQRKFDYLMYSCTLYQLQEYNIMSLRLSNKNN
ncbi:MAG: hypothetical protein E7435_04900 [Ruminococcaceae bacterium]|nr:hypothetical protein [Oscillospiraceae bacterium]